MANKHKHVLKIKGGVFRRYSILDKNFRANYEKATPHRPAKAEKQYLSLIHI